MNHKTGDVDPNPFVVKSKKLPMIEAMLWTDHVRFKCYEYNTHLTPTQCNDLRDRFGVQIMDQITPEFMQGFKDALVEQIIQYAQKGVGMMQKRLQSVLDYKEGMK